MARLAALATCCSGCRELARWGRTAPAGPHPLCRTPCRRGTVPRAHGRPSASAPAPPIMPRDSILWHPLTLVHMQRESKLGAALVRCHQKQFSPDRQRCSRGSRSHSCTLSLPHSLASSGNWAQPSHATCTGSNHSQPMNTSIHNGHQ